LYMHSWSINGLSYIGKTAKNIIKYKLLLISFRHAFSLNYDT